MGVRISHPPLIINNMRKEVEQAQEDNAWIWKAIRKDLEFTAKNFRESIENDPCSWRCQWKETEHCQLVDLEALSEHFLIVFNMWKEAYTKNVEYNKELNEWVPKVIDNGGIRI